MTVGFSKKVRMFNRNDGSYMVYRGPEFLGVVRKINKHRWTCAPLGAGQWPEIEVTEHLTRCSAVERLVG